MGQSKFIDLVINILFLNLAGKLVHLCIIWFTTKLINDNIRFNFK